jgi:hypothetical protein
LKAPFADEVRMSIANTRYATDLNEWLPSQPRRDKPSTHVERLARGTELPFEGSTARFRRVVEAS